MKYKIFQEIEIQSLLTDYYQHRLTIKQCIEKYSSSKSTIIKLLKTRGTGGRSRSDYNNNKYSCNESFFEKIDSHEKAYWFGFIAADGNIYNNKLQIGLHKNDEDHLRLFCKRVSYDGPLYQDGKNCVKLIIARKKLVEDLKKLGLVENKTHLINETIFNKIPNTYLKSAILGYIDGDGSFFRHKKAVVFSIIGNESFLHFLKEYFVNFNLTLSDPRKDKRTKSTFYASLFINQKRLDSFLCSLYNGGSEDYLERKKNKLIL
jgi:hypothetical protein